MKFQKTLPFEKHFKDSLPHHLSPIYIVVCPMEGERKKLLSSLVSIIERDADFKRASTARAAIEHLRASSLFSGKMGALFDGVDQLLKGEMEPLLRYVSSPSPSSILILGASSSKNVSDLYKIGKKEMVILDLSLEKPWEAKERITRYIIQLVRSQKKEILPSAIESMFEMIPLDRLLMQQEVEKLITFIGEKKEIDREDVKAICSISLEENPFQLAQTIAFGTLDKVPKLEEISILLPLVSSLRSQLEMGLKMTALLAKGASKEEMGLAFPKLWPKALESCLDGARKRGSPFFKKALLALFDFELGLKSSKAKPATLFTLFCARYPL